MTAPIRSMSQLLAALRDAVHERGVSYQTVDEIAGLADRYTSKILAPNPPKNMGLTSFGDVLGAIGKGVLLVDDIEQIARVKGRWTPRKRPLKASASITPSTNDQPPAEIEISADLHEKLRDPAFMREIGLRGNHARNERLSPWHRKMLARRAAKARWARAEA